MLAIPGLLRMHDCTDSRHEWRHPSPSWAKAILYPDGGGGCRGRNGYLGCPGTATDSGNPTTLLKDYIKSMDAERYELAKA